MDAELENTSNMHYEIKVQYAWEYIMEKYGKQFADRCVCPEVYKHSRDDTTLTVKELACYAMSLMQPKVIFTHSHGADYNVFANDELLEILTAPCEADSASTVLKWAKKECRERGWILCNPAELFKEARKINLRRT